MIKSDGRTLYRGKAENPSDRQSVPCCYEIQVCLLGALCTKSNGFSTSLTMTCPTLRDPHQPPLLTLLRRRILASISETKGLIYILAVGPSTRCDSGFNPSVRLTEVPPIKFIYIRQAGGLFLSFSRNRRHSGSCQCLCSLQYT